MAWVFTKWFEKVTKANEATMNNVELGIKEAKELAEAALPKPIEAAHPIDLEDVINILKANRFCK